MDEGIDAVNEALEERSDKSVSSGFLTRLLELVLKHNIFEFNGKLFKQLIGTAMGTKCAPNYSNVFMARKIDSEILKLAAKHGEGIFPIRLFKRFLDDIVMLWCGTVEKLHMFIEDINTINPAIQFTLSHTVLATDMDAAINTCTCEKSTSLAFLDTSLSIKKGKVDVDLFRKPTDRNQYLLTSSCHPGHVTSNIPYSLALRIVRICTNPDNRDIRLKELKELLLSRDYKASVVNTAIERARSVSREDALKKTEKTTNNQRPVFVIQYDPRLPSITSIVKKHWRTMTSLDPQLKETFPLPPLVAYKVPPNLKSKLVRARVPKQPAARPRRLVPGMTRCGKANCPACPYIATGKTFSATSTNFKMDLATPMDCSTRNICYAITCSVAHCRQQYIGQSGRSLKERLSEHLNYIDKNVEATGRHFNLPGHSKWDLKATVLEKVHDREVWVREERESLFIRNSNTFYKGINKKP